MKEFPQIALESWTLDQFEALERQMVTESMVLDSTQHSLKSIGGVSRSYVMPFSDHLPPEIALESFSSNVTKQHQQIALESLGLAIGFVAGVGLIAVLGGVYLLMKKLGERALKIVKVKQVNQVNKAYGELPQAVEKFRSEYRSIAPELAASAAGENALAEIEKEIKTDTYLFKALEGEEGRYIHAAILSGDYTPLSETIGSKITREIDALVKYLDDHVLQLLDKAVQRGKDASLEEISEIDTKAKSVPPFGLKDEIHRWASKNNIKELPEGGDLSVFQNFRRSWFNKLEGADLDALRQRGIKEGVVPNEQILKGFSSSQDRITACTARIDRISKRASSNRQIPTEVTTYIRRNLEHCREAVLAYNDIYSTIRRENEAITQVASMKGQSFSATMRDLQQRVAQLADNEHRAALQDAVKAISNHYTR